MSTTTDVTVDDLCDLLRVFARQPFDATCENNSFQDATTIKCENILKKDYSLFEIDNSNGDLSPSYPARIFIPECEHGYMSSTLTVHNTSVFNQSTSNITPQSSTSFISLFSNIPSSTTAASNSSINAMEQNLPQQLNQQPQYANSLIYPHTSTAHVPAANPSKNTIYEDQYDMAKIRELIKTAKYARCRKRFTVPVILYRGKYVCRSSTISLPYESTGRILANYALANLPFRTSYIRGGPNIDTENNDEDSLIKDDTNAISFTHYHVNVINSDIQLLKALNVTTIADLMVENRKMKCFLPVSSSEKADPENNYEDFNILSLPYPGCEFFKTFHDNDFEPKGLFYDWDGSYNDAVLKVPTPCSSAELNIEWKEYRSWDLVLITQNYLKACLKYIKEEKSGILIHCISGWDRTPLFISLVRLSLWADGLVHQSLTAAQITYFTLAYDWYLFGHQLPDRLRKGEDIMLFCFQFLKFITDDEFSIVEHRKRTKTCSSSGSNSSVIILKSEFPEDELMKESMSECYDHDSCDSFSNSSICDISIMDNYYRPVTPTDQGSSSSSQGNNTLTNRSPNPKRTKTSPILVPGAGGSRQRHESTSSTGSWQVVTDTGSLDSTMNSNPRSPETDSNNGKNTNARKSKTKRDESMRKQRLNQVRAIFIKSYSQVVPLQFKEGSGMNVTKLLGSVYSNVF